MKEELLHYLFRTKQLGNLFKTTSGKTVSIDDFGLYNLFDGPDFLNCKIKIDNLVFCGSIEFHINSADWYKHQHQFDKNYSNVILHMVMNDNAVVTIQDRVLDCVNISEMVPEKSLKNYDKLKFLRNKIPCQNLLSNVPDIYIEKQLEIAFANRLNRKIVDFKKVVSQYNGDFELALMHSIAFYIGGKSNSKNMIDFYQSLLKCSIKKLKANQNEFEYVLNYLLKPSECHEQLHYLERKFGLTKFDIPHFCKSGNYPGGSIEIKINLLLFLLHHLEVINSFVQNNSTTLATFNLLKNSNKVYQFFPVKTAISNSFISHVFINVLLPAKLYYNVAMGKDLMQTIVDDYLILKSEKNGIINSWNDLQIKSDSAYTSQALIELKNEWCLKKNCLFCTIGNEVLKK